jgi:hypothetical protein
MPPETQASFYCLECEMLVGPMGKCPVCEMQTINLSGLPAKAELPAKEALLGQEFGGCEIRDVGERDALSVTCRAQQVSLNRPATLKIYPLSKLLLPVIRQTVVAARRMASLSHPCIAPIYKVGVRDSLLFVALPLAERTLKDHLASRPIDPPGALAILKQIAEGVRFAHNEGLLHGNLRPENILVDAQGQCKIFNFGAPVDDSVDSQFYWPPERWLAKEVDGRGDLYSLGLIFYQMLCGFRPFEVREPDKLMFAHVNLTPSAPYQVRSTIPRGLSAIAMKLLEKDPESRYPTGKDLMDDITRYEANLSVRAHQERQKTVLCKLCETENAVDEVYCTFCKEPLSGRRPTVRVGQRSDEFQCDVCKRFIVRGAAACGNCMSPVCTRCRTGTRSDSARGFCPRCEAEVPKDPGLLKKMTDFFRKKK